MTRTIFITSIIVSVVFFSSQVNAAAKEKFTVNVNHSDLVVPAHTNSDNNHQSPPSAHPHPMSHPKRAHVASMDEIPHIHHFHKERVKKIKKHHSKFWMIAKLILVLCHVGLLILGYIHATH